MLLVEAHDTLLELTERTEFGRQHETWLAEIERRIGDNE